MKDLDTFREEIQQMLEEEIVGRYYYHEGRIEQQIEEDPQLQKALSVISNPIQVKGILGGEKDVLARINQTTKINVLRASYLLHSSRQGGEQIIPLLFHRIFYNFFNLFSSFKETLKFSSSCT